MNTDANAQTRLDGLRNSASELIEQRRFGEVPPLLEQAAAQMDNDEKAALIPFVEATALEISFTLPADLEASRAYELAANLAEEALAPGDDRVLETMFRAANHYAAPNYLMTKAQARKSAARAVELCRRLQGILRRHRPELKRRLADAMRLEVYCAAAGDPMPATQFERLQAHHEATLAAVVEACGEMSPDYVSACMVYGTFLERNGRAAQAREFERRAAEIDAALEKARGTETQPASR